MKGAARDARALLLFTEVLANGGIQRFNQTLLNALERLEVRCQALSLNDPKRARAPDTCPSLQLKGFGGDRFAFVLALARTLATQRFDIVLVGHVNFATVARIALGLFPWSRPRTVFIAHGIEVWSGIGPLRRFALGRMDRILCVSHYTRDRVLEQAPALAATRLTVFPNALAGSWSSIVPAAITRDLPARFVLSVTRLEPGDRYKGIATVIEALAMVSDLDIDYVVVGAGRDIAFLKLVAERFGVSARVHFWTGVTDAELVSLYRKCLAFVLPSGKEGFGIVFLEAMYFGAPVVAAREKGAMDVVRDGETGLSVPFGDVIALRRAIERLANDAALVERLQSRGRSMVTADGPFTFERFKERCAEALLNDPPVPPRHERGDAVAPLGSAPR